MLSLYRRLVISGVILLVVLLACSLMLSPTAEKSSTQPRMA
jgi:hypothetical protein